MTLKENLNTTKENTDDIILINLKIIDAINSLFILLYPKLNSTNNKDNLKLNIDIKNSLISTIYNLKSANLVKSKRKTFLIDAQKDFTKFETLIEISIGINFISTNQERQLSKIIDKIKNLIIYTIKLSA